MFDFLYVIPFKEKMTIHERWIQFCVIQYYYDGERERKSELFSNTTVLDTVVPPRRSDNTTTTMGGKQYSQDATCDYRDNCPLSRHIIRTNTMAETYVNPYFTLYLRNRVKRNISLLSSTVRCYDVQICLWMQVRTLCDLLDNHIR